MFNQEKEILREQIKNADCILIGAGAGLTAAAGINYGDTQKFKEIYPAWAKRGFNAQYELMGYRGWTMKEQWGYYTVHLDYVYFSQKENDLYQKFRELIGEKEYFVMTSNVDELFHKNGFENNKIFTPQGSYGKIQCTKPCIDKVWDVAPFYEVMKNNLNLETQVLKDESAIPKCPNCGEDMFLNVRIDGSFIESPYDAGRESLTKWVEQHKKKKMLLIEIGAGFNTPMVIRYPMERIAHQLDDTTFIRINPQYPEIDNRINSNKFSISSDVKYLLF